MLYIFDIRYTAEKPILIYSNPKQHADQPQCHREKMWRACTHTMLLCFTPVSCLVSVDWAGLGSLPACLPACLCVFMSCSCTTTTTTSLLFHSSEGYEKSRSLNNIAGMAGNTLRVSPVTSPYGSPCPLRRSRSPIPSILWDVQLWATSLFPFPFCTPIRVNSWYFDMWKSTYLCSFCKLANLSNIEKGICADVSVLWSHFCFLFWHCKICNE